jgi:hypothetical protein
MSVKSVYIHDKKNIIFKYRKKIAENKNTQKITPAKK